ncbi:TPA: hypothetical protein ACLBZX_005649 [Bacillus cereus]
MDFSKVQDMNDLKELVSDDKLFSNYYYYVEFYDGRSTDGYQKVSKEYSFGNEEIFNLFGSHMKKVQIKVYKDIVILHCPEEGSQKHERELDFDRELNEEEKILAALYEWKGYNKN